LVIHTKEDGNSYVSTITPSVQRYAGDIHVQHNKSAETQANRK